jgi:transposase
MNKHICTCVYFVYFKIPLQETKLQILKFSFNWAEEVERQERLMMTVRIQKALHSLLPQIICFKKN